jgi:hypothetical protein
MGHPSAPSNPSQLDCGSKNHLVMSLFVWVTMGVALWHFAVFVPDRFYGGIIGALVAAVAGSTVSGLAVAGFAVPSDNPPGLVHALAALPGAVLSLLISYLYGSRVDSDSRFDF